LRSMPTTGIWPNITSPLWRVIIRLELRECQPSAERMEHEQVVCFNDLLSTLKLQAEEYRALRIDRPREYHYRFVIFFFGRRGGSALSGVAFYLVLIHCLFS
jgi:hypothetical protein